MDLRPGWNYPGTSTDSSRGNESNSKPKLNLMPPWIREIGDTMKSKKRELLNHATALYTNSPKSKDVYAIKQRSFELLQSIFQTWDASTLQLILEAHEYELDEAISTILRMEEQAEYDDTMRMSQQNFNLPSYKIKNPLPDDFLRVPGYRHSTIPHFDLDENDVDIYEIETSTISLDEMKGLDVSTIAHDDGTLYGRDFQETPRAKEVPLAVPITAENAEENQPEPIQTMTIEERRRRMVRPGSRTDSIFAKLTVFKRSKLDIVSAEDRIRTREPHRLLDCLTKASILYRNGLIGGDELENLRSMILTRMQPSKMVMESNMNSQTITDHQWNCLVLKCKGIRQALSIRIIKTNSSSQHTDYEIRTSDLETGVVVFTRRRFKEFHKLYRKMSALTTRVNGFAFPSRNPGLHKREDPRLAAERQPLLEAYLRLVASLVTPSPLTISRSNALQLLEKFLALPDTATLFHNTTHPAIRVLRVYAFHILQDITTPEGKVCRKFLMKPITDTSALDELGEFLDNVQAYMMEHRFDDMKEHVAHCFNGQVDDDRMYHCISDAIRHEVEECLCVPLLPKLWQALEESMQVKEYAMKVRMQRLAGQTQSEFGIPKASESSSLWQNAIKTLKEVDAVYLPVDKLRKILDAANAIHATYQKEHGMDQVLSGDDFLPIFIYVIVKSQLQSPLILLRVLNVLSDPDKRMGESGYYLASYEAALEHMVTENETNAKMGNA